MNRLKRKLNIAFIVNEFPALSETFILNQIIKLKKLGHNVDIYATNPRNDPAVHPDVERYNLLKHTFYTPKKLWFIILSLRLVMKNIFKGLNNLLRFLKMFKQGVNSLSYRSFFIYFLFLCKPPYDIIHCHFGPNGKIGMWLKKLGMPGKLITSFHGYDVGSYVNIHGKETYTDLFRKGDVFIVPSNFLGRRLEKIGCCRKKIVKLPVSLDIKNFNFKKRKIKPGGKVKILTVGRLVEKKGIEYSIKAVAKMIKIYPNIEYKIVGGGRLKNKLKDLIVKLGAQEKIKLLGHVNDDRLVKLYEHSHIFILTSIVAKNGDYEGQPTVLQEAQASGIPVISTIHDGIPEVILDGKSGFLVPEKNVNAIFDRLKYLIKHPESWSKMGKVGREFVKKRFDQDKLAKRLIRIYQKSLRIKNSF